MTLEYLTLNLPIPDSPSAQWVELTLRAWGEPIRWSITGIQADQCVVEAVVYKCRGA